MIDWSGLKRTLSLIAKEVKTAAKTIAAPVTKTSSNK